MILLSRDSKRPAKNPPILQVANVTGESISGKASKGNIPRDEIGFTHEVNRKLFKDDEGDQPLRSPPVDESAVNRSLGEAKLRKQQSILKAKKNPTEIQDKLNDTV